ncbi:putative MFS aflatoxin efflux pump [Xylariaceae sp. FL1019]|nr:putative MFS aflatoxin efflux pump [Xylariaceae sp. FL1019]
MCAHYSPEPLEQATEMASKDLEDNRVSADSIDVHPTLEPQNDMQRIKFILLLVSIYISIFLIALDQLIVSTAIPRITDEFHSIADIGWYGSAYLLTSCSFQLIFGKIYTLYSVRAVYLTAIFLFEAGSAICGAAPSSAVLIGGRALQGIGAAGMFSGSIVGIVSVTPLNRRALYMGLFGVMSGVASIMGPLVGGAFTSNLTWRWCFYINLPIGAVSLVLVAILLRVPARASSKLPLKTKLLQLDIPGTVVFVPGVVSLLLALQWGGVIYPWNGSRLIALLTLASLLLVVFIVLQYLLPRTSTIPPRIIKQRSILTGFWAAFTIGGHMNIFPDEEVYFVPIWFQAIQGVSAVNSGVRLLPMTLATIISSLIAGALASVIGYYTPFLLLGSALSSIGAGLLSTLELDTSMKEWIGYQVLYGLGLGASIQAPNLAAQSVLQADDVPIGASVMLFGQLLGGAVFIAAGQTIFNNALVRNLGKIAGFDQNTIEQSGATSLRNTLPPDLRVPVLTAYNDALRGTLHVGLVLATLTVIGGLGMEWINTKASPDKPNVTEPSGSGEKPRVPQDDHHT